MIGWYLGISIFVLTFILSCLIIFLRMRHLRDSWEKGDILSLLSIATITGTATSLMLLLGFVSAIIWFGLDTSSISSDLDLQGPIEVLFLAQIIIILLFPLYDFYFFGQEGKQATESYHRFLENINDWFGSKLQENGAPRLLAVPIMFLIFFGLIGVFTVAIDLIFQDGIRPGMFVLFLFLLYPMLLLSYYTAKGTYSALLNILYFRNYKSFGGWLAVIFIFLSGYSMLQWLLGLIWKGNLGSKSTEILIAPLLTNQFYSMPEMPATFIVGFYTLFSLLLSFYFTIQGFRNDYIAVTPLIRMYDYLFTAYLASAVVDMFFLTLINSHPKDFLFLTQAFNNNYPWFVLDGESVFISVLTSIEDVFLVGFVIFSLVAVRFGFQSTIETLKTFFKDYLDQIRQLDTGDQYEYSQAGILGSWSNLQTLYLNKCRLNHFPESLCGLQSLTFLQMNENNIEEIPTSFGRFQSLSTFQLSNNRLRSLPRTIGDLSHLTSLHLSNNHIREIPDAFGKLPQLQELIINMNDIHCLPDTFGDLRSLQHLEMADNHMKSFPLSFSRLSALEYLQMVRNDLVSLPEGIGNLNSLERAILNNNDLSFVPEGLQKCSCLSHLDLRFNPLGDSMVEKQRIKSLVRSNCELLF